MTTDDKELHRAGYVAVDGAVRWGIFCGASAGTSLIAGPSLATCQACLKVAAGEPRVVSGLDTAAATPDVGPVKPTGVAVGQRWRYGKARYAVVEGPNERGQWGTRWENEGDDLIGFTPAEILADEFLGTVPAPVSAPGQSTPVETPPTAPVTVHHVPAAPAPGVGEGPRELTFAEACAALSEGVEVEWRGYSGVEWNQLFDGEWNAAGIAAWSSPAYEFRRRPEPLPAPAPRVSRVAQMVRETSNGQYQFEATSVELEQRLTSAVRETLEAVATGFEKDPYESIATQLARAKAAMLEPRS